MTTENEIITNEANHSLCYEYRTYDPARDVVHYKLTYDRVLAYTHDQFAIPLYVQTVEIPETNKGVLLHSAIRVLQTVNDYFLRNDNNVAGKSCRTLVNKMLVQIIKQLRKGSHEFGNRHESKTGNGALHVKRKDGV